VQFHSGLNRQTNSGKSTFQPSANPCAFGNTISVR
jgi:hypothetical protein